jgi:arylsulfatase A-like enzyme
LPAGLSGCGDPPAPPARATTTYDIDGALLVPFQRPVSLPNLLFVLVDTLRADAVGDGAGQVGNMPWLAGLGRRGTLATQASSNAPWTPPSLASMLSGLAPSVHGCRGEEGGFNFPAGRTTFAEALSRGHGYETAAFMGISQAGQQIPGGGTPNMFAGFRTRTPGFMLQGVDPQVRDWAQRRDRGKPFFLFLHTYEAHHPYGEANHPYPPLTRSAPPTTGDPIAAMGPNPAAKDLAELMLTSLEGGMWLRSRHAELFQPAVPRYWWNGMRTDPDPALVQRLRQAYGGGTAWVDGMLRRAVEQFQAWGLLENTLLVVTADHGEGFAEHGMLMHGRSCYDELLRVPIVLAGLPPFDGGKRLSASVSPQDVLPTFFDLAGLPALDDVEGRSFLPLMTSSGPGRPVLAEEWVTLMNTGGDANLFLSSVRSARWKVIVTRDLASDAVTEVAYDLVADPGEQVDVAGGPGGVDALPLEADFRTALATARERSRAFGPPR